MLDLGSAVGYLLLDTKGFESGFNSALGAVKIMQSQSATAGDKFAAMGSAMTTVGGGLTRRVTLPLIGVGAASVTTAAKFESSMSQVQATLGVTSDAMSELNGQSVNTMEALENLALNMGATTKFSASEAAYAINSLAMAGYDVQEIYDALPEVLSLASAGAIDLEYATQLVANGLNVMGMGTEHAKELADKLAVTSTKAYGAVSDFGEGLLIAGAQASLCNVSLTDTLTALGILGDNGIAASEGGTYLRNTLKNLYTPTEDAAKALEELGVTTANSDGTLRDFQVVLQDLDAALDGLTDEERIEYMSRIFDTRTISAANALLENSGERWDELSYSIDNASGAAEKMADTQLDNLSGQLTILKSSLESAAIAIGNVLLPVIKQLTNGIQKALNWFNNLSTTQKRIIVTILGVVSAIGPLLVIFGKLSTGISAIIGLFSGTGGLAAAMSLLTGPIGAIIAAVGLLAAAWATDFGGIREVTEEIVGMIKETVQKFLDNLKYIWENDLYGIRTTAEHLWESIQNVFEKFLAVIKSIFKVATSILQGDWEGAWEAIKELAVNVWEFIKARFDAFLQFLVDLLTGIATALYDAAVYAWNALKRGCKFVWKTIKEWWDSAVQSIVDIVSGIAGALYDAGVELLNSFWEGLKSVWSGLSDWLSGVSDSIMSAFGFTPMKGGMFGPGGFMDRHFGQYIGSYASGADYITHDSIVQVHEGEGILTKEQNRAYRNRRTDSSGDTFNFYSPKALNPTTAAREMKRAKQQLALGLT